MNKFVKPIFFFIVLCIILFVSYNAYIKISFISSSESINIALEHANILKTDAKLITSSLEYEDGVFLYEVDFIYNNFDYDYLIDAKTGDVIKYEIDR